MSDLNIGILYIVGTPIGNLEDMTFRAVTTLKKVDLILAEDASNLQKLLQHYEIKAKVTNYYANSKLSKITQILDLLKDGKKLALVSDAGMPTISDPGSLLIKKIYTAKSEGLEVLIEVVPGPTAIESALSLSGFTGNQFTFFGFLPHKKGRETLFREISENPRISIFYESVHRIEKCFTSLADFLEEDRVVTVARELTKLHESVVRGNIVEVQKYFADHQDKLRGEFVVVIDKLGKS